MLQRLIGLAEAKSANLYDEIMSAITENPAIVHEKTPSLPFIEDESTTDEDESIPEFMSGTTLLHHLARSGQLDCLRLVLRSGADINAVSDAGLTPLFNAVIEAQVECVKELLRCGAKVSEVTSKGCIDAYFSSNADPVSYALDKPGTHDDDNEKLIKYNQICHLFYVFSPIFPACVFHRAIQYGHEEIIKILLSQGNFPQDHHFDLARQWSGKYLDSDTFEFRGIISTKILIHMFSHMIVHEKDLKSRENLDKIFENVSKLLQKNWVQAYTPDYDWIITNIDNILDEFEEVARYRQMLEVRRAHAALQAARNFVRKIHTTLSDEPIFKQRDELYQRLQMALLRIENVTFAGISELKKSLIQAVDDINMASYMAKGIYLRNSGLALEKKAIADVKDDDEIKRQKQSFLSEALVVYRRAVEEFLSIPPSIPCYKIAHFEAFQLDYSKRRNDQDIRSSFVDALVCCIDEENKVMTFSPENQQIFDSILYQAAGKQWETCPLMTYGVRAALLQHVLIGRIKEIIEVKPETTLFAHTNPYGDDKVRDLFTKSLRQIELKILFDLKSESDAIVRVQTELQQLWEKVCEALPNLPINDANIKAVVGAVSNITQKVEPNPSTKRSLADEDKDSHSSKSQSISASQ